MIRFGIHSSVWTANWTMEAADYCVPKAASYGLDLIEIALLNPSAVDVAHSQALFAEHNVAPTCSLGLPASCEASQYPDKATEFLAEAIEVAHALGSNTLTGVTYSTIGHKTGSPPTEGEYETVARALKPIAKRAGELGMTLGLEPCNRYETHLLNTAAQTQHLISLIDEPATMIHLDTYHMNIEEKGFAAGIEQAGDRLRYIHLSESDRGVPGTGTVDWDATLEALAVNNFQGDLVMESFVTLPPEIAQALSVWRPVAKDADEVLANGLPFLKTLAQKHGLI